ncbi:MAG: penicillin-binding transpeptidase domain-containing protein [Acidimicrobiia bacterium]
MNAPLRKTAWAILIGFGVLVLATVWIQAVAGPEYRDDPRNPRLVAWRVGRERGAIISADAVVTARSDPNPRDPQTSARVYPTIDSYAHTVGYVSVLFGSRGLERVYEGDLVSHRDSTLSGILNALLGGDPRPRGLRLTIDDELQRAAVEALSGQRGSIIAINPSTGEVLASVSTPGFDPNSLVGPAAAPAGRALEDDPDQPLLHRTINTTYPPGSSFKIITTAAALETGVAGPATEFPDPAELELPGTTATIHNYDDEVCLDGTTVTLAEAFVRSCNTTFAALGMAVGGDALAVTAEAFGFNQEIPYDLPVLSSAFPEPLDFAEDPPATAQNALGQRDVRATPIQMALVAAAVANQGNIMVPFVVADVFTHDGKIESTNEPELWRRAISPASAAVLTDLMEQAVISGTGRNAAVPGIRVAGKTGTAQVTGAAPDVWFVGFAPVDPEPGQRQIALAVVLEDGGPAGETASGGSISAPIAAELFEVYLK